MLIQTYLLPDLKIRLSLSSKMADEGLDVDRNALANLNLRLEGGWIEGGYDAPSLLLAYEPTFNAWYFVVDDSTPIIELSDEEGGIYTANIGKCRIHDGVYVCHDIQAIHNVPITDRQYFANESLVPLLDDDYLLE